MRCMLACYRMIMQHFLHRGMTWEQMAAFTGYKPGIAPWTIRSLVQFERMGFDIRMIEPFDYARYGTEGDDYLTEFFEPHELDWFKKHSDLTGMKQYIGSFLDTIDFTRRSPTLKDIDAMLDEGRLVTVTLNSRALNRKDGFVSHMLLLYGRDGGNYFAQDPGPDPQPERRIPAEQLWTAMGGENNRNDATGFKLKKFRNMRLDQWVTALLPELSRSYAAKLIGQGKVKVNDTVQIKPGYKLREGDDVQVDYDTSELDIIPDIDLPILYEDETCVVIDKPAGVLVHSKGALKPEATVATWLRTRLKGMEGARAGIVHRLDRATSGVMICAKTPEALAYLQKQFADRSVQKTYLAVVNGTMQPPQAVIDMPIERNPKAPATFRVGPQGKPAQTEYRVLSHDGRYSLLELKPKTGRTHQLRVHLSAQGRPIIGDILYGGEPADRLYLHAAKLRIRLPNTAKEQDCTAELPASFETFITHD